MPKTVTLRLKDEVYKAFVEAAQAENRPLSNFIETAAFARVREQQFVDDVEMAEIRANQDLIKRINKGSQEARSRKGRFVE
jgi:predicted transcriptional regulator